MEDFYVSRAHVHFWLDPLHGVLMRDWSDVEPPLTRALVNELLRDSCVFVGKARPDDDPQTILQKSFKALRLDRPQLPQRPKFQREALYFVIVTLLERAKTIVVPYYFPWSRWMEDPETTTLSTYAELIYENQSH
jgi:hypothetical protein